MIKVLCSPFAKLFLFLSSFVLAIFLLRSINITFDRAVEFAFNAGSIMHRPTNEGVFFGRNIVIYAILFCICGGLLLFSIWKTKPKQDEVKIFIMWRNLDLMLIFILTTLIALFSFSYLQIIYAQRYAVFDIQPYVIIGLPLISFTFAVLAITELVARIRDKTIMKTLYWVHYFRIYPIWKPLSLLLSLLLLGSFFVLFTATQEIMTRATATPFWVQDRQTWLETTPFFDDEFLPSHILHIVDIHSIVPAELIFLFSLLILISTTYFVTFALTLSKKYDEASAEKVRAEQFKSELITNVSHDIRTPLTSVINYIDLLKKTSLEDEASEYVSVLDRKADRLKILIEDLMYASKVGSNNEDITIEAINLGEILGQISGEFDNEFIERDLTVVLKQPEESTFINADSRHLWRVLENLFSNVSKYALTGTRVFAEIIARENDRIIISIKNTSELPIDYDGKTLTEQFIRGDKARQSEGSGLGLYIAKNLVELMDGQFEIQATGDLFVVEIVFNANEDTDK
ncbi:MAG: HAMP domain-containing histidine kinase [Oscillospiraceae bacterium]|nr:HAMP domain-containing histidine kinase [Oscillospiraceae bacterium]